MQFGLFSCFKQWWHWDITAMVYNHIIFSLLGIRPFYRNASCQNGFAPWDGSRACLCECQTIPRNSETKTGSCQSRAWKEINKSQKGTNVHQLMLLWAWLLLYSSVVNFLIYFGKWYLNTFQVWDICSLILFYIVLQPISFLQS